MSQPLPSRKGIVFKRKTPANPKDRVLIQRETLIAYLNSLQPDDKGWIELPFQHINHPNPKGIFGQITVSSAEKVA